MGTFRYEEFAPDPALAPHVRTFWRLVATDRRPRSERVESILPDGCFEVIVHLADPFAAEAADGRLVEQERVLVVGPTTVAGRFARGDESDVIGIRFEPGAATLLGLPPSHELRDLVVPARALGCAAISRLAERVVGSRPGRRRSLLETSLLDRMHETKRGYGKECVRALREHASVARAAASLAMSTRQFERVFADEVGFPPARLRGLWRFQEAVRLLDSRPGTRGAELAQLAGYSDEAHLCREFRRHAGITAGEYLRERGELTAAFVPKV